MGSAAALLQRIALRLRALLRKGRVERELDEEVRYHLEMQIEENRRRGMSVEEARAAAMRSFGGVERFKEECREARGVRPLENLASDLRFGLRVLRKNPMFGAVAIAIMALGIGVTTAVFSIVRAYLFHSLPYPGGDRLVYILRGPDRDTFVPLEGLDDVDWSSLSEVFDRTVSWDLDGFNLRGEAGPESVDGAWVNPDYFEAFNVKPALGRVFDDDDVRRGGRTAVISYGLWQRRFGGDSAVIGRRVKASSADRPYEEDVHTIVGVLPRDFWYVNRFTDLLVPLLSNRPPYIARLAPGVGIEEAQSRLNVVIGEYVSGAPPGWYMALVPAHDEYVHRVRPTLLALLGAVALVLVIACANVGGLLTARATNRRHEVAIRAAVGAGRRRIVQQLLTEAVLLATLAGALGTLFALLLVEVAGRAAQDQLGTTIPGGLGQLGLDLPLLAFALGLSVVTGLAFGLLPAFTAVRRDLKGALHGSGARSGHGIGHARGRDGLMVAQIAFSFALLVSAGLMVRSVLELQRLELGFEPQGVTKASVLLPEDEYPDPESRRTLYEEAIAAIRTLPQVSAVGLVWPFPFRPGGGLPVTPEGLAEDRDVTRAVYHAADSEYFELMPIRLLRGRLFDARDHLDAPLVALVSRSLAERLWPSEDPIGKRLKLGAADSDAEWRSVVGVVADVRESLSESPEPDVYIPHAQALRRSMFFMIRSVAGPGPSPADLQRAIASVDPNLPVSGVIRMAEVVAEAGSRYRFLSLLLGGLATFAVILTATGLYSTLAYTVSQRAREIAIRVALGAQARSVFGLVVGRGAAIVGFGLALGVAASFVATGALSSQLFGVRPLDPITYAAVGLLVATTALAAMLLPGRRALKLDPARVLRGET